MPPEDVSGYMKGLPPKSAQVLRRIRALVRKVAPDCDEVMSYGIPAFSCGRVFMYCAAFKSHVGIYPPVRDDARLIQKLKSFANAKGNLRFPLDAPIPYDLIERVAKSLYRSYARKPDQRASRTK